MKKTVLLILSLVLTMSIFTACGCTGPDMSTPAMPTTTPVPTMTETEATTRSTEATTETTMDWGNGPMPDESTNSTNSTESTMTGSARQGRNSMDRTPMG